MSHKTRTCQRCSAVIDESYKTNRLGKPRSICYPCQDRKRREDYIRTRERRLQKAKINYEQNRERIKATAARYREANRGKVRQASRRYYHEHRDELSVKALEYRMANRERLSARQRAYAARNPDKVLRQKAKRARERRQKEPAYRLRCLTRARAVRALKNQGLRKSQSTIELLGCSSAEYARHIESQFESGMSWSNQGHGPGTWQVDHTVAIGLFDLTDPEQLKRAFHYTNTKPLWHEDHRIKTIIDLNLIRARERCPMT